MNALKQSRKQNIEENNSICIVLLRGIFYNIIFFKIFKHLKKVSMENLLKNDKALSPEDEDDFEKFMKKVENLG